MISEKFAHSRTSLSTATYLADRPRPLTGPLPKSRHSAAAPARLANHGPSARGRQGLVSEDRSPTRSLRRVLIDQNEHRIELIQQHLGLPDHEVYLLPIEPPKLARPGLELGICEGRYASNT